MPSPEEQAQLDEMKSKILEGENSLSAEEDELTSMSAPVASDMFHKKPLHALVIATNKLLPLFGVTEPYGSITEDVKTLPADFTKILGMFSAAISDAVAEDVLSEDLSVDLDSLTDDSGLISIAGKLGMVSKSLPFKKFLKSPPVKKVEEEVVEGSVDPTGDAEAADSLFAERM